MSSFLQQFLCHIKVRHIIDLNAKLRELHDKCSYIMFMRPEEKVFPWVCSLSDVSFSIHRFQSFGETDFICGLVFSNNCEKIHASHLIDRRSSKQRRVSHPSHDAEILACTQPAIVSTTQCCIRIQGS